MNYRLSREELKSLLLEVYHLGASSPFDLAESIVESVIEDQLADKVDKQISSYITTTVGANDVTLNNDYVVANNNVVYDHANNFWSDS